MWLRKKSEGGKDTFADAEITYEKNGILTVRLCIVIFRRKKLISRLVLQLQKALVQSIETDEEMKFLKDSEELQSFIKEAELK